MKFIKYIITLAALSAVVCACEKEIDVNLRSVDPKIVIEGEIREGETAKVRVSNTVDFNDNNGYPSLQGAAVNISDDNGNTETLVWHNDGWYRGQSLTGVAGRSYRLSVEYQGASYSASSKMPPQVEIDSITMYELYLVDRYVFPEVHFRDPLGADNTYYRCLLSVNGEYYNRLDEQLISAEYIDGSSIHNYIMIDDEKYDELADGDEIFIELQCIDKDVYKFFDTLSHVEFSLTNPTSNLSGGALGYFSAYSFHQMTVTARVN